jgi:hypothetical protein
MKFLVVIPTIRRNYPGFDQVIERIRASFTLDTEFNVLDGSAGKSQTLNSALAKVADSDADVYVTMDDDFVPTSGWQDRMADVFTRDQRIGSLGIWLGEDQEMLNYMGYQHIANPIQLGPNRIRKVNAGHHVVGCIVAMRTSVALAVGPVPESTEKYQFWEDGWRGRRVTKLGFDQAFVDAGPVEFVRWQDTKEYQEMRERDIASAQEKVTDFMKQGGVAPTFFDRVKGKLKRMAGKR